LALADCLEALERNSGSLEACIAKYPDYQEELGVLLRLAATLKRAPAEAEPRGGFLDDLRSKLMEESTINSAKGGETE
jgi:hypothetical protein